MNSMGRNTFIELSKFLDLGSGLEEMGDPRAALSRWSTV